ncbi:unnamed protein product [Pseudo-nitzschia multistriata]|uniref:Protein kinase domain-containing protein n=1 Tax=Pseudo-nitzschia multistriata TaxID=183589 RepID=A0A448ZQ27_9STRA|nr:unnamed protein product [Pseudo-nitzschia multistriata]
MIKRHSSHVEAGVLPFAAMDDNTGGSTGGLQRTSVHGGRRLAGKSSVWLRILGGTLFLAVASLYIVGVRHVTLHNASVPFSPGRGLFHDLVHKNDANGKANANAHRDQGAGTARNLHRPIVVANARSAGQKPRVLGHYYARADAGSYVGTEALSHPLYDNRRARIPRGVFMTKTDIRRQRDLLDSDDYENGAADVMEDMGENCTAQYDWQEGFFPTCNHLMEIDMTNLSPLPMFHEDHYNNKHDLPVASSSLHSYSKMISHGYWRDVWTVENLLRNEGNPEEVVVLKTMRYTHDYKPRNYDRHRRDAVTMERLTSSTFIVDIYAACGNSGLFEYADGGSLDDSVWYNYHHEDGDKEKPWTPQEKVIIGYQAASGLADLHNFAKEGVPAVAHTDIGSTQFVYVDKAGVYKLNDFNRARFLAKNNFTNEICTYEVGNNPYVPERNWALE